MNNAQKEEKVPQGEDKSRFARVKKEEKVPIAEGEAKSRTRVNKEEKPKSLREENVSPLLRYGIYSQVANRRGVINGGSEIVL